MWIPVTIAAATFQILRTARQHDLRDVLSTGAAGFVRYAYGAPWALAIGVVLFGVLGRDLPHVPSRFWPILAVAAVTQIIGTVALLASFRARDFAIGTVYAKSEVLIVAGLAAIGLGTPLGALGWVGAGLVTVGVAALAARGPLTNLLRRAADRAAVLGVVAGTGFAFAAISIAAAAKALDGAPAFDRAVVTLTVLLVLQAALNAGWFLATDPAELARTARAWRPATRVGLYSLLGSIGWAWAFTLESAAKVRTLGQVELLIAFAVAHVRLGERHDRADLVASGLVLAGVLLVAVAG